MAPWDHIATRFDDDASNIPSHPRESRCIRTFEITNAVLMRYYPSPIEFAADVAVDPCLLILAGNQRKLVVAYVET
jgi:hypothetical protein